jgi:hypothetical protein
VCPECDHVHEYKSAAIAVRQSGQSRGCDRPTKLFGGGDGADPLAAAVAGQMPNWSGPGSGQRRSGCRSGNRVRWKGRDDLDKLMDSLDALTSKPAGGNRDDLELLTDYSQQK